MPDFPRIECPYPDWGMNEPNCPHYQRCNDGSNACEYNCDGGLGCSYLITHPVELLHALEVAREENNRLRNGIGAAMDYAANRWDEWGERAVTVAEMIDAVLSGATPTPQERQKNETTKSDAIGSSLVVDAKDPSIDQILQESKDLVERSRQFREKLEEKYNFNSTK